MYIKKKMNLELMKNWFLINCILQNHRILSNTKVCAHAHAHTHLYKTILCICLYNIMMII